jgi:ABC-2 type transport system ATP-binding protein
MSPPNTDAVIRFDGVSKKYGQTAILRNLDFEIAAGAFVGLAGVNGAGKTTLIKCLLDFCHLDSGRIHIFGHPHRSHHSRTGLAFLPERFVPPYYLSGREFLRAMQTMSQSDYHEDAVRALFREMDLPDDALEKPSRALSKGTTQKLGLAGCLLSGKDLYVLDEPMSGLDPQARARVKTLFQTLRGQGKTMLFTSHSLADIGEICDHMLVLHQGSIAFSGAPDDLRRRYGESTLEQAFLRCIGSDG